MLEVLEILEMIEVFSWILLQEFDHCGYRDRVHVVGPQSHIGRVGTRSPHASRKTPGARQKAEGGLSPLASGPVRGFVFMWWLNEISSTNGAGPNRKKKG